MVDCVFCTRIDNGEFDYFDEYAVAFAPNHPVVPGHFLVIPRAMRLAASLADDMRIQFNIITSAGAAATQTVEHTHLHVVRREAGDGLRLPWTGQDVSADPTPVSIAIEHGPWWGDARSSALRVDYERARRELRTMNEAILRRNATIARLRGKLNLDTHERSR